MKPTNNLTYFPTFSDVTFRSWSWTYLCVYVNLGMFALWDHAKEADICLLWPREHLTLAGGGGGGAE